MDLTHRDLKPDNLRALAHRLATVNPIVAFWIVALARLEVDEEILRGGRRLVARECASA